MGIFFLILDSEDYITILCLNNGDISNQNLEEQNNNPLNFVKSKQSFSDLFGCNLLSYFNIEEVTFMEPFYGNTSQ